MRPKKHHEEAEVGELNLVPYMDIMVNLIMFMLFTMTSFVEMKVINVSVPAISDEPTTGQAQPDKPQLAVVLGIMSRPEKGYIISVNGTYLEGTTDTTPTVRADASGNYDFAALTKRMATVKSQQPEVTVLTIVPDPSVDYNSLVKTMDAIRYDEESKPMYPDVLLGVQ